MYLIDTSAWIEFFSKDSRFKLANFAAPHEIFVALPIYQEVLQGIKNENAFRAVKEALEAAYFIENPLSQEIYEEAISLYRIGRKSGVTIRSSVDCLIAAAAIKNNLVVLHNDRDFSAIAGFSSLQEMEIYK